MINVDLDRITQPETKGVDWRTRFEDNPNEICWSDGAVLKSDTVRQDRQPDVKRALHFRSARVPGPIHCNHERSGAGGGSLARRQEVETPRRGR